MTGRIVHFEVPYDDGERARAFYREAFGWNLMEMPEMNYTMASTGPVNEQSMPSEPGFINGGMFQRTDQLSGPMLTVDVPDIDAAFKAIESLGGERVGEKMPVGDMGFAAYFKDPEGNVLGLWQTS
ncbi:VOC family protein [Kribbella solani]|uniref:Putative enzyme related to lactoylglutathione lyase n=1 Tax=Kribbella solani TaxID=236067 RepID=A0A841DFS6_9ACTN|nr:VOC family protein [Kribbella solani]MBB5976751.1 putative enzyme related to lactoylglutathione lyase [Kribbella solani]